LIGNPEITKKIIASMTCMTFEDISKKRIPAEVVSYRNKGR
jgi:hypothetical protein